MLRRKSCLLANALGDCRGKGGRGSIGKSGATCERVTGYGVER